MSRGDLLRRRWIWASEPTCPPDCAKRKAGPMSKLSGGSQITDQCSEQLFRAYDFTSSTKLGTPITVMDRNAHIYLTTRHISVEVFSPLCSIAQYLLDFDDDNSTHCGLPRCREGSA